MKITTLEKSISKCMSVNEWENDFKVKHKMILEDFPFSVILEGSTDELGMAVDWCLDNLGERNTSFIDDENYNFRKLERNSPKGIWTELWYGKMDYDYGSSEFFFSVEGDLNNFKIKIPDFYSLGSDGNKWRTDGTDEQGKIKEYKME